MGKTLKDLLHGKLEELALPSNIRYGKAIHDRGGIEIIKHDDQIIEAWVGGLDGTVAEGGSQRRHTTLEVKNGKLVWRCTETAKPKPIFCKHCVALALSL